MIDAPDSSSTRPYLIRALYDWCGDNGLTPYIAVQVDGSVQVPMEYVKGGEIVLNISLEATSALRLGNEFIEFKGRFAGKARDIMVPVGRVMAIYAKESGQGMSFPVLALTDGGQVAPQGGQQWSDAPGDLAQEARTVLSAVPALSGDQPPDDPTTPPGGAKPRPALKRVK